MASIMPVLSIEFMPPEAAETFQCEFMWSTRNPDKRSHAQLRCEVCSMKDSLHSPGLTSTIADFRELLKNTRKMGS